MEWDTNCLQRAGFIISSVYALNKGRGGMQAIIGVTAVNQDLVISCYKSSSNLVSILQMKANKVIFGILCQNI